MATKATGTAAGKRPGRWWRRWLITCLVWAIPVVALGVKEMVSEMLYDSADLKIALARWDLTDAQRALPGIEHCSGTLEDARRTGCPAAVVQSNLTERNVAIADVHTRRDAQIAGFFEAAVVYWLVPCLFILAVGFVLALIRRALRRPPPKLPAGTAGGASAGSAGPAERPR